MADEEEGFRFTLGDSPPPRERGEPSPPVQAVERDGQFALVIDGVVQSVAVRGPDIGRGYWPAMLPPEKPSSALILGLGGGTIANLLTLRFGPLPITGVDDDPAVLALARERFGVGELPNLRVVMADAFAFAESCSERFAYVAVDLFAGGQVPREVTGTPFLRHVRWLLAGGGLAAFNLARDRRAATRIHRLGRVFRVERQIFTGLNVVVHCRVPARRPRAPGPDGG